MKDFQILINLWAEKINRHMIKTNVERHVILSPHSSESPLSFNFKSSAIFNNNNTNPKNQKDKGKEVEFNNMDDINEEMEIVSELSEGMY